MPEDPEKSFNYSPFGVPMFQPPHHLLRVFWVYLLVAGSIACKAQTSGPATDTGATALEATRSDSATTQPTVRPSNTACLAPAAPPSTNLLGFDQVFSTDLKLVLELARSPRYPDVWYALTRAVVYQIDFDSGLQQERLDLTDFYTDLYPRQHDGLATGLAFHPIEPYIYTWLNHGSSGGPHPNTFTLVRFTYSDEGIAPDSRLELFSFGHARPDHVGGRIGFGSEGALYVSTGDGYYHSDVAQDPFDYRGKLLRLNVDIDDEGLPGHYSIPSANLFLTGGGSPKSSLWGSGTLGGGP